MSGRRPNILWICTDQQRFDTIGALGNRYVSTPTIDRLVAEGTAFDKAYCQAPICTPSRSSFLTGVYPSTALANRNGNDRFSGRYPLVTRTFADAGYLCGNIGKLHLASPYQRPEPRADDGYAVFQYSHAPRDGWPQGHDYADWVRAQGGNLGELTRSVDGVPAKLHQTTWAMTRAIEFITANRDRPWLLTVNVYDPHPPFNPPAGYRAQFDPAEMPGPHFRASDIAAQEKLAAIDFQSHARHPQELDINHPIIPVALKPGEREAAGRSPGARDAWTLQAAYYAMIKLIDDQLARVLATLDELGLSDDTIVLFMSDHGETLGDHGLIEKGCRFYEGLVRVPMIWRLPEVIRAGAVSRALVELTDVAPTLLDFTGIPAPEHYRGKSLRGLLEGRTGRDHHRDFVRAEYYDALDLPDASRATMYRDERYKLVVYHGHRLGELFDLDADPHEFDNLWDDPGMAAVKLDLLHKSYDATVATFTDSSRRIGPY
ncbi:MAG TPA: sulfatase-like hydrolase/transferase [Acetobacteraceae bacterium]|nr:sulfatase-like hydrolase/transferase [Acetobacteraceae bacterium]